MQKGHLNPSVGHVLCLAPGVLRAAWRNWAGGEGCYYRTYFCFIPWLSALSLAPLFLSLESLQVTFQRINLWEDVNSGEGKLEVHVQTLPDFKPLTCSSAPYFFPTDYIPRDSQGLSLLGLCEQGTSARWPYSLVQACRFSFPSST